MDTAISASNRGADCLSLPKGRSRSLMCPSGCMAVVLMLWMAALVPKPENGVRTTCKSIHQNPTGLPVGAVSSCDHASNMAYIVRPTCPMLADEYAIMAINVSDSRLTKCEL